MLIKYINANGEQKTADLSAEQVARLKVTEGFKVLDDPLDDHLDVPFADDAQAVN